MSTVAAREVFFRSDYLGTLSFLQHVLISLSGQEFPESEKHDVYVGEATQALKALASEVSRTIQAVNAIHQEMEDCRKPGAVADQSAEFLWLFEEFRIGQIQLEGLYPLAQRMMRIMARKAGCPCHSGRLAIRRGWKVYVVMGMSSDAEPFGCIVSRK